MNDSWDWNTHRSFCVVNRVVRYWFQMIENMPRTSIVPQPNGPTNDQWLNADNKSPPNFLTFIFLSREIYGFAGELTINAKHTISKVKETYKCGVFACVCVRGCDKRCQFNHNANANAIGRSGNGNVSFRESL